MVDSTVESRFADDRTYTWQGKKVDEQTHLGFDLAKLQHSPVPASNDGRVIWADDLGIYGNCIVIDHGFGLESLYGHLSQFLVKKGDMVKKGQIIGTYRVDRPCGRRSSAFQHAARRRSDQSG